MPALLRTFGLVLMAASVTSIALSAPASADQAFHTLRLPLTAVADAPLASGAVIDVHAQGPTIYAQERYLLVGARAGTSYQVTLYVNSEPGCTSLLFPVPTATMTTNAAGNAEGKSTLPPEGVAGLPRTTYYLKWQVSTLGGPVAYTTECVPVILD